MLEDKPCALYQQRLSTVELHSTEELYKSCGEQTLGSEGLGESKLPLEYRGSEGLHVLRGRTSMLNRLQ